jgi:DNA-binding NarL/FixJ family response regulator
MAAATLAARLANDRFALEIAEAVLLPHGTGMDRRLLRRAGHLADICRTRLRMAPGEGQAGSALTSRELPIAQMAAAGASNRSIADHLHVSVRTVEGHLYNIYGKLKIADRVELRAALEGAGIEPS